MLQPLCVRACVRGDSSHSLWNSRCRVPRRDVGGPYENSLARRLAKFFLEARRRDSSFFLLSQPPPPQVPSPLSLREFYLVLSSFLSFSLFRAARWVTSGRFRGGARRRELYARGCEEVVRPVSNLSFHCACVWPTKAAALACVRACVRADRARRSSFAAAEAVNYLPHVYTHICT